MIVSELKDFGINVTENDKYQNILDISELACAKFCDRETFSLSDYSFFSDGASYDKLVLPITPVTALALYVSIDRIFTTPILSESYRLDSRTGIVTFYDQEILRAEGRDVVKAIYTAGYENIPKDIKACIAMTFQYASKILSSSQVGITTRNTDGGTESIEQSLPPLVVKKMLQRYKKGN
jgi:hypothetical protein